MAIRVVDNGDDHDQMLLTVLKKAFYNQDTELWGYHSNIQTSCCLYLTALILYIKGLQELKLKGKN